MSHAHTGPPDGGEQVVLAITAKPVTPPIRLNEDIEGHV